MKLVYIAGPYRAGTPWLVEQNIRRAEELGLRVAMLGAMPVIPHSMCRFFDGERTGQFWVDGTLELMRRCDAVMLVSGWTESVGTRGEVEEAKRIGIPVFAVFDALASRLLADSLEQESVAVPKCEHPKVTGCCHLGCPNNVDFAYPEAP